MSDFGIEHVNVPMEPWPGAALPDRAALSEMARKNAVRLQAAINRAHQSDPARAARGGVVYVSPGRYFIGRNRVSGSRVRATEIFSGFARDVPDVLVYPDVTLSFAPGAVLVPMNFEGGSEFDMVSMPGRGDETPLVRIEIQGEIDAELGPIFGTFLEPDVSVSTPRTGAGLILLGGTRIREVRPEWWGAQVGAIDASAAEGGKIALIATTALQAAIDAAHTHRRRPKRGDDNRPSRSADGGVLWWSLPSIPVVVQDACMISNTLRVGRMPTPSSPSGGDIDLALMEPNPAPFVLRGEREVGTSGGGRSTLQAFGRLGGAMLEIRGVPSFVLRDVTFDGNRAAPTLLQVTIEEGSGHGDVSNCTFRSVYTYPAMPGVPGPALIRIKSSPTTSGERRGMAAIAFTRCRIEPNPAWLGTIDLQSMFEVPVTSGTRTTEVDTFGVFQRGITGVELEIDDTVNVEFRTCFMLSVADPMISARRGHFSLNECVTHTWRVYHEHPEHGLPDGKGPFLNASSGTDVFIQAPRVVDGRAEAPASFTAREVESQSYQFLATFDRTTGLPPLGDRSACVLLNTHHTCVAGGPADVPLGRVFNPPLADSEVPPFQINRKDHRPSVFWAGPGILGSHLISVGCRWKEQYETPGTPPWSGPLAGIRLANGQSGSTFLVGSTTTVNLPMSFMDFASTRDAVRPDLLVRGEDPSMTLPPFAAGIRTMRLRQSR